MFSLGEANTRTILWWVSCLKIPCNFLKTFLPLLLSKMFLFFSLTLRMLEIFDFWFFLLRWSSTLLLILFLVTFFHHSKDLFGFMRASLVTLFKHGWPGKLQTASEVTGVLKTEYSCTHPGYQSSILNENSKATNLSSK